MMIGTEELISLRFNAVSARSMSLPVDTRMARSKVSCLARHTASGPPCTLLTTQPARMRHSSISLQVAAQTSKTFFTSLTDYLKPAENCFTSGCLSTRQVDCLPGVPRTHRLHVSHPPFGRGRLNRVTDRRVEGQTRFFLQPNFFPTNFFDLCLRGPCACFVSHSSKPRLKKAGSRPIS